MNLGEEGSSFFLKYRGGQVVSDFWTKGQKRLDCAASVFVQKTVLLPLLYRNLFKSYEKYEYLSSTSSEFKLKEFK